MKVEDVQVDVRLTETRPNFVFKQKEMGDFIEPTGFGTAFGFPSEIKHFKNLQPVANV